MEAIPHFSRAARKLVRISVCGCFMLVSIAVSGPWTQGSDFFGRARRQLYSGQLSPLTGSALEYSTYFGGNGDDMASGIAVDGRGNAYIVGTVEGSDGSAPLPIGGSVFPDGGRMRGIVNAFVAKVNANGTLAFTAYLGGAGGTTRGNAIALDAEGNLYVTGFTSADDFPVSSAPFQPAFPLRSFSGVAYVSKISSDGSQMLYSTFLGGRGKGDKGDEGFAIAVDRLGNAYVAGSTNSIDFPLKNGVPNQDQDLNAGQLFLTKLNPGNHRSEDLLYSTWYGGSANERAYGVAVDASGGAYLTGVTGSLNLSVGTNFQTTANALISNLRASTAAFVMKIDPVQSGTDSLVYASLLGGNLSSEGYAIAVDSAGDFYVTGQTNSNSGQPFPTTSNAFQTASSRAPDQTTDLFLARFKADLSGLSYSTYLGEPRGTGSGSWIERGYGVAVGAGGKAYVIGVTQTPNLPVTVGALQTSLNGESDGLFAVFDTSAKSGADSLLYCSYLGGEAREQGSGITLDSTGGSYGTGWTNSNNFPTRNPIQATRKGDSRQTDAFISKIFL